MAIVVEDGTGKIDSNSYISEAELTAYATARGVTVSGTAAELLIVAMDYIEAQPFKGDKATEAQALQWPRLAVWIDGYPVDSDEIPQTLKDAQAETAISIDAGNNPTATTDRETRREKVGDIEVEYSGSASSTFTMHAVNTKLDKLLKASGLRTIRA